MAWYDDLINGTNNLFPHAPAVDNGPFGPSASGGTATLAPPVSSAYRPGYIQGSDPAYEARLNELRAQQASIDSRRQYGGAEMNWANAQASVVPFRYGTVGAQRQVLDAQGNVIPYRYATLGAQRNVLGAEAAVSPFQRAQLAARQGVITATGAETEGQRNFLNMQQGENAQQRSEFEAELAASRNVGDQSAVATAQRQRNASDTQARSWGITPEADVVVPDGATGSLAPGTRQAYQTQEQNVARANTAARTARGFDMKSAQLVVSLLGNDRQRAQQVADQAGMSVADAQQAVNEAQIAAGIASNNEQTAQVGVQQAQLGAGYASNDEQNAQIGVTAAAAQRDIARANDFNTSADVSQASLDYSNATMPPFPGAVHPLDPSTGLPQPDWVTPAEADAAQTQYEQNRQAGRTAINSGGSQIAGVPTQTLLNQYGVATYAVGDPNFISTQQIESELVRRFVAQGYNQAQAKQEAAALIAEEMKQRQAALDRAKSGRPSAGGI